MSFKWDRVHVWACDVKDEAGGVAEKLSHLADVVSLNDFPPTDQELQVHAKLTGELGECRDKLKQIVANDVTAFNARETPAISVVSWI